MFDILIKNGTIIDGTGQKIYQADVGVRGDKIASIGNIPEEKGKTVIDASGLVVTPGFIDIQNHSDAYWTIFLAPEMESLIYQGVTTIICGKCGSSLAPLIAPNVIESIHRWADLEDMQPNWETMEEFLEVVERQGLSVNFATLVGHTTLRYGILGNAIREATVNEIEAIKTQTEKAMHQGAFGYSAGLSFAPANTDSTELLIELARVAGKEGGMYSPHLRSESRAVVRAVQEAITIGKEANIPVHISHLKTKEAKNWHKIDEVLELIRYANEDGHDVTFDIYPYTATGSAMSIYLPDQAFQGGNIALLKRLRDPFEVRKTIIPKMREMGHDFSHMRIAYAKDAPQFVNKRIIDLAENLHKSPEEIIIDIIIATENQALCFNEIVLEENIVRKLQSPYSMIGSGGPGYSVDLAKNQKNLIHPRSFGTFVRIFQKYVREQGVLTWEDAVKKMTSMPAKKMNLEKRGIIQKKYIADLAIWDAEHIGERSEFENPYQYATGVKHVIVNGKLVLHNGEHTRERAGSIMRFHG